MVSKNFHRIRIKIHPSLKVRSLTFLAFFFLFFWLAAPRVKTLARSKMFVAQNPALQTESLQTESSGRTPQPLCVFGRRLCFSSGPIFEILRRRGGGGGGGPGGSVPPPGGGDGDGGGPPGPPPPTPTPKPPLCPEGGGGFPSLKLACFMPQNIVAFIARFFRTRFTTFQASVSIPTTGEELKIREGEYKLELDLNQGMPEAITMEGDRANTLTVKVPAKIAADQVLVALDCNPSRYQPKGIHLKVELEKKGANLFTGVLMTTLAERVDRLRCDLNLTLLRKNQAVSLVETTLHLVNPQAVF